MSDIAIRVENLHKQYKIGVAARRDDTLRDAIMNFPSRVIRGMRHPFSLHSEPGRAKDDHIWALQDISFDVKYGEVLGIIGRNGAGKSTLLKILSRITEPTHGRAEIHGRVGSLLEVGTGFHGELTGRENVYLNGAILGMSRQEIHRKFDEIVDFAGVEKFIDTPIKRYSSGMTVRLAFSVAAHLEPEILVVDEVLAVGDASFQKKCLGKMDEVRKGGRTVLFVSHNMAVVENLCSRALLLRNGILIGEGATSQVINRYIAEISELSRTSLADRTDRQGRGDIIIRAIEIVDDNENLIEFPMSGQTVIIRLYYSSRTEKIFRNCRISLNVRRNEQFYFFLSTELVDTKQLDLFGDGFIDFIVEYFPLSEGNYNLTTFIEANGIVQDWVENASELSVVDGDFHGTGRNYPQGWQGKTVLVKHRWKLGHEHA